MKKESINVLFICSGNSGRSIMAESILNRLGDGLFNAFSAGSHPTGRVNPFTIHELLRRGYPTLGLVSKSWLNFAEPSSVEIDFVITVCKRASAEIQPRWPGNPKKLEWQFRPPGEVAGSHKEVQFAFEEVCKAIEATVKEFVAKTYLCKSAAV